MINLFSILTWLSVLVLGPGAVAVFVWFCRDFAAMMRDRG